MILTRPSLILLFSFLSAFCWSCNDIPQPDSTGASHSIADSTTQSPTSAFDSFLQTDFPPADGFDFPLEDRNGKDWGGEGGGITKPGQPVYAIANGRIVAVTNDRELHTNVIVIEHTIYENYEKKTIRSLYVGIDSPRVKPGEIVQRRQQIGTLGGIQKNFRLEIRFDSVLSSSVAHKTDSLSSHESTDPTKFIEEHRKLFIPQKEKNLVLIDQGRYLMRLYTNGTLHGEYDVGFGQEKGRKRIEGDKRTPKGMYFIVEREQGDTIKGPTAAYMGKHWLKLNYPNKYDAAWGLEEGHISAKEERGISALWPNRKPTPQNTELGGGIGIHGWIQEWREEATHHRSWGCIVMHNRDIPNVYHLIPMGTMVVVW